MMDLDQIKRANANPKEFARSRLSDYEAARHDDETSGGKKRSDGKA
jgi:hypothetical protein